MKKVSKVMYILAIIWNIFSFIASVGLFVGYFLMKKYPDMIARLAQQYGIEELNTVAKVLKYQTPVIVAACTALAFSIVMIIVGIYGLKALNKKPQNSTPQIVVIVFSVLCGELFYLLAGIFGTINASQEKTQTATPTTPTETENKQE